MTGSCCRRAPRRPVPPARQRHRDDGTRMEALSETVSQFPERIAVLEQHERPADRVDRDVHVAVVVEVGGSETAADDLGETRRVDDAARVADRARRLAGPRGSRAPGWARCPCAGSSRESPPFATTRSASAVIVQVDPGVAPADRGSCAATRSRRASFCCRERRLPAGDGALAKTACGWPRELVTNRSVRPSPL